MDDSPNIENLNIQLGDIIQINAPSNSNINDKIYFIKYLDKDKIILINQDKTELILNINEDGEFDDESIVSINILSRDIKTGYAEQNNLLPGTWIDIYFGGEIPLVITGLITNLENDMIEIKTYPSEDIIYIDFEYKGLPELLLIDKIIIRSSPEYKEDSALLDSKDSIDSQSQFEAAEDAELALLDDKEIFSINKALLIEADDIEFGNDLDEITQIVDVPEHQQRYGINIQTNDMLNDLLSQIPNIKRTPQRLNEIHILIERYKELREIYSNSDDYSVTLKIKGDNYKPLVESLKKLEKKLYWLLPIVKNNKKVYDIINEEDALFIDELTLAKSLIDENELINNWKANLIPEEQNKYNFYIQQLNKLYTPFTNYHISNYITSQEVETNLITIIDTLNDQYSYVAKDESIKQTRFVSQIYNLGLTRLVSEYTENRKIINNIEKLTANDTLLLKSFLLLPFAAYKFSSINLPNTNIMIKSDLNMNFINYWELLKNNTSINTILIDNIKEPLDISTKDFFNNIKEILLDETLIESDPLIYEKYLNTFIPKTEDIFEIINHSIKGALTLSNLVKFMQPFLIYMDDLTIKTYEKLKEILLYKILEFKKKFVINSKGFQALYAKLYGKQGKINNSAYTIFNILAINKEIQIEVLRLYNISEANKINMSNEELFNKLIRIDFARLFMSALSKITLDLMVSNVLDKFIDIDQSINKKKESDTCNKYVLTKKYFALDELEEDNDKIIYVDKKYDHTYYDIVEEYKTESEKMSKDEFKRFLINQLVENIGLTFENAERDAKAMIEKRKEVINGDYALLELMGEKNLIYKREDNKWVKDVSLSENVFFDTNKFFCESKLKCYDINDKCIDEPNAVKKIQKENLRKIIGEFDEEYRHDLHNIRKQIDAQYLYNLENINRIIFIEKEKKLKYNKIFLELGNSVDDEELIQSPYEKLRDLILGQSDLVQKQAGLLQFALLYTRKPYPEENQYWLYCNQTNIKLIPSFLIRLAKTFTDVENYKKELDIICAEQGTISDDGDKWVDKYSGYEIRKIEYDNDEGYTDEGYRLQTRALLEADLGNIFLQEESSGTISKKVTVNNLSKTISNVVFAMAQNMQIKIDHKLDFIIKQVIKIQNINLPSEEDYNAAVEKSIRKGEKKKLPTYTEAADSSLLILIFVYLLVAIQISIPSIQTQKTFPGCIKSFSGYPMAGKIDKTSITYIACVANKISSSIKPWNSIYKLKPANIEKKMEAIIEKYVINDQEITSLYKEKKEFLLLEESDIIPETLDIQNWLSFLPPLIPIKVKTVTPLSSNFIDELLLNIKKGNPKQEEDILIIKIKIDLISLSFIQSIQTIIEKEQAILTNSNGDPFLENACCNSVKNTIDYFIDKDKNIIQFNSRAETMSNLLYDIRRMGYAGLLYDPLNTRRVYPIISKEFSEKVIFKTFIFYCKFNSDLSISEELRTICTERPKNFNPYDTIDTKISLLKAEGKNYSLENFEQLILYISKNNIIPMDIFFRLINSIELIRSILLSLDQKDSQIIPSGLRDKLLEALDTYNLASEDKDTTRDLKNYLYSQNEIMKTKIIDFIKKHGKLSKIKFKHFEECINDITDFEDEEHNIPKILEFIKTNIKNIIKVFPNIVLNKIDYENISIPRHWNLSEKHNNDIKLLIKQYYLGLNNLYDDQQINSILTDIQHNCKDIELLIDNIYYLSPLIRDGVEYYSIFDKKLCLLLGKYSIYNCLIQYIEYINNSQIISQEKIDVKSEKKDLYSSVEVEKKDTGYIDQIDVVNGEKKLLATKISNILTIFMNIICNSKDVINFTYKSVMDKVIKTKEKEKNVITDFLKGLTDEEREIENLFKNNKLEKWNKGLQKGLTQYVSTTYDEERDQMEKQAIMEVKLGKKDFVTNMNKDIFKLDAELEAALDAEINQEEYFIGDLPEDDDFGDADGDELY